MAPPPPSYFHVHLVSDATGETLTTIAKAAAVQYSQFRPIEHMHPLVRTARQLKRVLQEIEQAPGIVLYTIINKELTEELERRCRELLDRMIPQTVFAIADAVASPVTD